MSALDEKSTTTGTPARRPLYDFGNFNAKVLECGIKTTMDLILAYLDGMDVFEKVLSHSATKCVPKALRRSVEAGNDDGLKTVMRYMINALVAAADDRGNIKFLGYKAPTSAWWAVFYKLDDFFNAPQGESGTIELPIAQSMAPMPSSRKHFGSEKEEKDGQSRSGRRRGAKSTRRGGRH